LHRQAARDRALRHRPQGADGASSRTWTFPGANFLSDFVGSLTIGLRAVNQFVNISRIRARGMGLALEVNRNCLYCRLKLVDQLQP
jgi:hypothetical protein